MKHLIRSKSVLWRIVFASMFVLSLLALSPQAALAQDPEPPDTYLDKCMNEYQNPTNCTANDVRIEEILNVQFLDGCDDEPDPITGYDYLTATFTLLVSAENSPDRYDIGLFMARDGQSAAGIGACYRDYLAPPLNIVPTLTDLYGGSPDWMSPDGVQEVFENRTVEPYSAFWDGDGDACGDMPAGTQVFLTDVTLTVACSDSADDDDTLADISICASWDNQPADNCTGALDAYPGTPSKCSCTVLNFPFTPTALEQMSLEARSASSSASNLVWGGAGLLIALVAGASGSIWMRRKQTR